MKIRIICTVDVDPDKWADQFDVPRGEVRQDVQAYFEWEISEQLELLCVR